MQTKVKTVEELRPLLAILRAAGKKIVFTNGCFDLIHTGHTVTSPSHAPSETSWSLP